MKRGRKPKPTEQKRLAGNPGKRPLNKREPKPPTSKLPLAPDRLDGEALAVWDELAPQLQAADLLADVDRNLFAHLCDNEAIVRAAADAMKVPVLNKAGDIVLPQQPLVIEGATGALVKNPLLNIMRDHANMVRLIGAEFGLSPSARASLHVPGAPDPAGDELRKMREKKEQRARRQS